MALDRELDRLRSELENAFNELRNSPRLARRQRGFAPSVDVLRTDDPPAVVAVVDLAGVDPADVRLAFDSGVLIVSGVRNRPVGGSVHRYEQMEIEYGPFERRVPIGDDVDVDGTVARYQSGMLVVRMPVATQGEPAAFRVVITIRGRE